VAINVDNTDLKLIIIGVRSPICVEVEEVCYRNDFTIEAAISLGSTVRWLDQSVVVEANDYLVSSENIPYFPCAFAPLRRRELVERGNTWGLTQASALIDPSAIVARSTKISDLVFINSAVVVGAASIIRKAALLNRSASIGHHCVIGEFCSVGPSAVLASNVIVGNDTIIGAGAIIGPDTRIGSGVVVSAGAVVLENVPDGSIVRADKSRILENASQRLNLMRGEHE